MRQSNIKASFVFLAGITFFFTMASDVRAGLVVGELVPSHNVQNVGGESSSSGMTYDVCRGAKFRADREGTLVSFGIGSTSGWNSNVGYYVYESPTQGGAFTQVPGAARFEELPIPGSSLYQMTEGLGIDLEVGSYYVALVCWSGNDPIDFLEGFGGSENMAVGEYIESVYLPASSLSGTVSFTPLSVFNSAAFRIVTAAGHGAKMVPSDLTSAWMADSVVGPGSMIGNVWSVTEDRVLTGFDMLATSPSGSSTNGIDWQIYSCPTPSSGTCTGPWNLVAQDESMFGHFISGSGLDPGDNVWMSFDSLYIQLEAGNDYFIGVHWRDQNLELRSWSPSSSGGYSDPDWAISHDRVVYSTASPSTQVTLPSGTADTRSVQVLYTTEGLADEVPPDGGGITFSDPTILGSVFELWGNTSLEEYSVSSTSQFSGSLEFGVYLSLNDEYGPWTLIETREIELFGYDQRGWHSTGPLGVTLDAGAGSGLSIYYMLAIWGVTDEEVGVYYQQMNPHPGFEFGTGVGTYILENVSGLSSSLSSAFTLSANWPAIRVMTTIVSTFRATPSSVTVRTTTAMDSSTRESRSPTTITMTMAMG
jgi:hypothetical protein